MYSTLRMNSILEENGRKPNQEFNEVKNSHEDKNTGEDNVGQVMEETTR